MSTRPPNQGAWPPGIPSGATDARAARIFLLVAGRRANDIPEFSGAPLSRSTIARRSPLPTTLQLADGLLLDPTGTAGTAPPGDGQPPAGAPAAHGYILIVDTSCVHRVRWNGVKLEALGNAWEELRQGGTLAFHFDMAAAPCKGGSWPC